MIVKKKVWLLVLTMLLGCLSGMAASVRLSVQAGYGSGTIRNGDTFYIIYKVSDTNAVPSAPTSVPGAKVLFFDRTGSESNVQIINGHASGHVATEYTLTLRASQEGKFSFGPVSVGGARSNTVSYSIGSSQSSSRQPQQNTPQASSSGPKFVGTGNGNLFLRASVSKTTAYENEALVYTVKLYCTFSAIRFVGAASAPKFEGFVVEESQNIDKQLHFENYNGKNYATAVIARYIIFPQMKGQLKVLGNNYTVAVDERQYYSDPIFGNLSTSTPVQLNVKPNDLTVNVKALPQPQPADFSGGVGKFRLVSSLPSQKFLTNQAASIIYTVEGSGNLKYVKLPDLNQQFPKEIEVYTPDTDVKATTGADNVSGSVRFDYSFMPLEEGDFRIPDVKLVYFNPSTGQYETSMAKGYTITVGKGKASAKSQSKLGLRFDPKLMPAIGILSHEHRPYVRGFLYWLWFIIPTVVFILSLVLYSKHIKNMSDVMQMRSRKAGKVARRRLRTAERCMKQGKPEQFYEEMMKAIWGYLGDKLKMPTSELNRENIADKLRGAAVDSRLILEVIDIVDECEFARYSPVNQEANMPVVYDKAVKVIDNLEGEVSAGAGIPSGNPAVREEIDRPVDVNDGYVNDHKTPLSRLLKEGESLSDSDTAGIAGESGHNADESEEKGGER